MSDAMVLLLVITLVFVLVVITNEVSFEWDMTPITIGKE